MHLLMIEDDPVLGKSIKNTLEFDSYDVTWARSFTEAKGQLNNNENLFHCILLDIGLPDGDGITLCKQIRMQFQKVPILFLTAQVDDETLIRAFDAGGNDFVKKPFSQKELLARLKAHTRDVTGAKFSSTFRDLKIDLENREVFYNKLKLEFNNTQIRILYFLTMNAEKVVTRDRLLEFLGKENEIFDRTIDSHISHIRKQFKLLNLSCVQIKSVYGVGYKLEIEE
jgi:DNA-binding response OmpR family regulator